MNKLEYIPGDLVIVKTEPNNHLPKGGVCEFVSYGNRNKVFVRVAKGIDTFFLGKEQITPIPLTPEILEKNGWEKDDRGYCKSCIFLNKDDFGGWAVGIGEEFIRTIIFVHELQHLFFGLGISHEMEV